MVRGVVLNLSLIKIFTTFVVGFLASSLLLAQENGKLEKPVVYESDSTRITFQFNQEVDFKIIKVPKVAGVTISRSVQTSHQISIINFKKSETYEYSLHVASKRPGRFIIPPLVVSADGKRIESPRQRLIVRKGKNPRRYRDPFDVFPGRSRLQGKATIRPITTKKTVYVGELFQVYFKLRTKFFESPDIFFREGANFQFDGFYSKSFRRKIDSHVDSNVYSNSESALGFHFVPLVSGKNRITFTEVVVHDQERVASPIGVDDQQIAVQVLPLPANAKPNNFSGNVGDFEFSIMPLPKVDRSNHEEFTITVQAQGKGNFLHLSKPKLIISPNFSIVSTDVKYKRQDTSIDHHGEAAFAYSILPQIAGTKSPGTFEINWFNPKTKTYQSFRKDIPKITFVTSSFAGLTSIVGQVSFFSKYKSLIKWLLLLGIIGFAYGYAYWRRPIWLMKILYPRFIRNFFSTIHYLYFEKYFGQGKIQKQNSNLLVMYEEICGSKSQALCQEYLLHKEIDFADIQKYQRVGEKIQKAMSNKSVNLAITNEEELFLNKLHETLRK